MNHDFYKTEAWRALRSTRLRMDGYRCRACGKSVKGKGSGQVDHILSRRSRPDLAMSLSNLQTLCAHCHNSTKQRDERDPSRGYGPDGMPLRDDGVWGRDQ